MNKRYTQLLFFCSVFFLLNACSQEDSNSKEQTNATSVLQQAQNYFSHNPVKIKENSYFTGNPDWAKADFKNDTLFVPLVSQKPIYYKDTKNKKISSYLFPVLIVTKNSTTAVFDYNLKVSFSKDLEGTEINWIQLYNAKNNLISVNGKKPIIRNKKPSLTARGRCIHWGLFYVNPETGQDRLIRDWWECTGGGGGAGQEEQTPPDGGGSGDSVDAAEAIEDYIDDTNLDPCTKDILNRLKNLNDGDIASMLRRFNADGSIFTIHMSTGSFKDNQSNLWANTIPTKGTSTDVTMVFNQDYINGSGNPNRPTDLSVATTMAHEVVHAYLISLLEQNKANGAPGIYDFPTVYEAYVQYQITNDKSILPAAHHELIAEKYVSTIAATIQEFHTGISTPLGTASQIYTDLAWSGLFDTTYFNTLYPNNPQSINYKDRVRISGRVTAEKNGSQYGTYSPKGVSCKK
ncbi:type III secretion system effector protein [Flavobacterium poyangense]|uniref:hypothetical protein n=1 Tax=Flavobacterium poyangense TaxID=2204302 RepID=UPI0014206F63|nr:hypothetical protein [Flavobacterium sp. JXAS1]